MQFQAPDINWSALAPMLIVMAGGLIGVLIEAFVPRRHRHDLQVGIALVTLVAAFGALITVTVNNRVATIGGSVVMDGMSVFLHGTLLIFGLLAVLTFAEKFGSDRPDAFTPMGAAIPGSSYEAAAARAGLATSEVFPLALVSLAGMMMFVSAGDLITMFVALEVLSLPLYVLCGLGRRRRLLSQEASLKYFLLGAFASAFFLFGAALLYGYAGTTDLAGIAAAIASPDAGLEPLLVPAILLVLVGLLFKIGAVPFHSWTPDVYQGAPTPVTGFMAAATKAAAFGAILRFVYVGVESSRWSWQAGLAGIAILTMVIGAVLTVGQNDIKRLLAYSSVAHAGFILVGVLAFSALGLRGVLFYLLAYGLTTIAAFAIVSMVRAGGSEATRVEQWAGLGRRHPILAATFGFLLLAFTGIPLTSGFTAKFAAFAPAVQSGTMGTVLVVIGVLASAITAYVYIRLIVVMYFNEPETDDVVVAEASPLTTAAIAVGTTATLVLGVFPGPVLELAAQAAELLR
ncbi:MAG: NADH-quinone oxidoreductase subunit NuoN [Actinomycetia bacterium]|nr:NADH-quinone oxidoreductase subunit NuoN [Actinomycetes bacterium]